MPADPISTDSPAPLRAVVLDDDRVARSLVERMLEAKGFEVVALGSALGAYEVTVSHLPHLLVVDVVMPGLDVEALVARVKATPTLERTVVLLLSGMNVQALEALVARAGAHGFLSKTRGPLHLQETIAAWAEKLTR